MHESSPDYYDADYEMVNPNLYVTLPETVSGRIWSADIFPWLSSAPWLIP